MLACYLHHLTTSSSVKVSPHPKFAMPLLPVRCNSQSLMGCQDVCLLPMNSFVVRCVYGTWVHPVYNPFVYADQTVSVDSPYFWNEAFALQHTASGQPACPTFLQPLAQGILSTGKSLLLLRAHQDHHRRSAWRACYYCGLGSFNKDKQA